MPSPPVPSARPARPHRAQSPPRRPAPGQVRASPRQNAPCGGAEGQKRGGAEPGRAEAGGALTQRCAPAATARAARGAAAGTAGSRRAPPASPGTAASPGISAKQSAAGRTRTAAGLSRPLPPSHPSLTPAGRRGDRGSRAGRCARPAAPRGTCATPGRWPTPGRPAARPRTGSWRRRTCGRGGEGADAPAAAPDPHGVPPRPAPVAVHGALRHPHGALRPLELRLQAAQAREGLEGEGPARRVAVQPLQEIAALRGRGGAQPRVRTHAGLSPHRRRSPAPLPPPPPASAPPAPPPAATRGRRGPAAAGTSICPRLRAERGGHAWDPRSAAAPPRPARRPVPMLPSSARRSAAPLRPISAPPLPVSPRASAMQMRGAGLAAPA